MYFCHLNVIILLQYQNPKKTRPTETLLLSPSSFVKPPTFDSIWLVVSPCTGRFASGILLLYKRGHIPSTRATPRLCGGRSHCCSWRCLEFYGRMPGGCTDCADCRGWVRGGTGHCGSWSFMVRFNFVEATWDEKKRVSCGTCAYGSHSEPRWTKSHRRQVERGQEVLAWPELLKMGRKNLRCVDWAALSPKVLRQNSPSFSDFRLSRPANRGEVIDFFVSHSWSDSPAQKWRAMQLVVEQFYQKNGRYPTFWIDKFCIDQNEIADGLRVLPVNVMSCRKMLCLSGKTYHNRLWCAWELCVLLSALICFVVHFPGPCVFSRLWNWYELVGRCREWAQTFALVCSQSWTVWGPSCQWRWPWSR